MNATDPVSETHVVRVAFLGAWQANRVCSWKVAVAQRTPHVLPSRAGRTGRRVVRRLVGQGSGLTELRLVGYSWGAWTALHLVDLLVRAPERVHPRLAHDPWSVRLGLLDPVRAFRRKVELPDDGRVRCWNVFQRNGCHLGCPGNSDWYRGQAIAGALNHEVTEEGRALAEQDGVPPLRAPDHIQLGYRAWNSWDARIASVLDGNEPF